MKFERKFIMLLGPRSGSLCTRQGHGGKHQCSQEAEDRSWEGIQARVFVVLHERGKEGKEGRRGLASLRMLGLPDRGLLPVG